MTEGITIGEVIIKAVLAVIVAYGLWSVGMPHMQLGEYEPFAEITYVETSAQQKENGLVLGNLVSQRSNSRDI